MRKYLLSSAAAVAIVAVTGGTSLAAELGDWRGLYIGGHLGLGDADFHHHPHHGVTDDGIARPDPDGIVGGIHAGYNWQIPADRFVNWPIDTFVLGLETDVSATGWSDLDVHPDESERVADADVNLLATLRARIGMTLDRSLLFVTGGLAYTDASWVAISPDGTFHSGDHNTFGGVVGLGAEWKQNHNISWRAEGLYYIFQDTEHIDPGDDSSGAEDRFGDAWVARLGFTYHFGQLPIR